jgi:hypothetical protein
MSLELNKIDLNRLKAGRPPKIMEFIYSLPRNKKNQKETFCIANISENNIYLAKDIINLTNDKGDQLIDEYNFFHFKSKRYSVKTYSVLKVSTSSLMVRSGNELYYCDYWDLVGNKEELLKEFYYKMKNKEMTAFEALSFLVL